MSRDTHSATRAVAKALAAVAQRTPATIHVNMPTVKIGDCLRIVAMQYTTVEGVEPSFTAIIEPPEMVDPTRLERAMWDALSDNDVIRIHADSWKELHDVAEAVAAEYNRSMLELGNEIATT